MSANTSTPTTSAIAPNTMMITSPPSLDARTLDAHAILQIVQPFGVIGVAIGDLADPATWVFQDGDAKAAQQALVDALAVVPAPDPVAVLSDKVDALTATVQDITAQVQTLIAQPVPVPPVTTIGVR